MTTALAPSPQIAPATAEAVLLGGDISKLSSKEKVAYYLRVCDSLGLNPLTQPFAFLRLNGKEVFYAKKDCTEQLRSTRAVTVSIVSREVVEGCYVVTARASMPGGRADESLGAVSIEGLKGENRSNAMMKAETKAKRRVTLSICGLGMLDESETDSIPGAQIVPVKLAEEKAETPAPVSTGGRKEGMELLEERCPSCKCSWPFTAPEARCSVCRAFGGSTVTAADTGEAPPAEELEQVRQAVRELRWTNARARSFFKMYFDCAFDALTADQCAAARELLAAASVDDDEASFEAAYGRLKAAGRVL